MQVIDFIYIKNELLKNECISDFKFNEACEFFKENTKRFEEIIEETDDISLTYYRIAELLIENGLCKEGWVSNLDNCSEKLIKDLKENNFTLFNATIVKAGIKNNKQVYRLKYNGERVQSSTDINKLVKTAEKNGWSYKTSEGIQNEIFLKYDKI